MGDGTEFDDALLGLPGFRVLAVTRVRRPSARFRGPQRPDQVLLFEKACIRRLMQGRHILDIGRSMP
jgi:hypothetical protein